MYTDLYYKTHKELKLIIEEAQQLLKKEEIMIMIKSSNHRFDDDDCIKSMIEKELYHKTQGKSVHYEEILFDKVESNKWRAIYRKV